MIRTLSGQKPGILLNILQCIVQPSTVKNHQESNVNRAEIVKPYFIKISFMPSTLPFFFLATEMCDGRTVNQLLPCNMKTIL